MLDIFSDIAGRNNSARLLLVGDGFLEQQIRQQVEMYGIADKVIFAGYTDQIDKFLCAMDAFVFPSFYMGFPNACIEAQASGLPCVISDTITQEVDQTGNVRFLSLNLSPEKWAEKLLKLPVANEKERQETWKKIAGTPYDLNLLGEYVEKLYETHNR